MGRKGGPFDKVGPRRIAVPRSDIVNDEKPLLFIYNES